jgi:hypothetical protein
MGDERLGCFVTSIAWLRFRQICRKRFTIFLTTNNVTTCGTLSFFCCGRDQ